VSDRTRGVIVFAGSWFGHRPASCIERMSPAKLGECLEVLMRRLIEVVGCARLLVKRFVALAFGDHDVVIQVRRMRGPQGWIVSNGDLP